ncbi:hypothetical protein [Pseudomonas putida]|uniref:hypothetical protein n=1 Tax=Pseudomonas putida TaxID=303 RepID=UPI00235BB0AC|nr:hypothetical protein [Pseudomonas putida]GLO25451.1 hypothetical protein PPUJ21368_32800 [Pseudomonas putida]HDS0968594.1 hypothetical protein [Pseudomonas putida]
MELKLWGARSQGDASKEYLIIKVLKDCNLNKFIVCDRTFGSDGSASNKHRHVYFFPSFEVKEGDYVWLYTRPGVYFKGETKDGSTGHGFCWGLNSSVWNESGDRAHLVKVSGIEVLDIPAVKKA